MNPSQREAGGDTYEKLGSFRERLRSICESSLRGTAGPGRIHSFFLTPVHETRSFNRYFEEAQGPTHASLENPPRPPGSHSLFAAWPSALARDLTFIATSDSHCITDDQSERNRSIRLSIEEMNAIDQRTWPEALGGGTIPRPRAVFINGDIIDDRDKKGETELQWSYYVRDFAAQRQGRPAQVNCFSDIPAHVHLRTDLMGSIFGPSTT